MNYQQSPPHKPSFLDPMPPRPFNLPIQTAGQGNARNATVDAKDLASNIHPKNPVPRSVRRCKRWCRAPTMQQKKTTSRNGGSAVSVPQTCNVLSRSLPKVPAFSWKPSMLLYIDFYVELHQPLKGTSTFLGRPNLNPKAAPQPSCKVREVLHGAPRCHTASVV